MIYTRKALELYPSNVDAHSLLGEIYYRQHKFDIADAQFQKAIALNPNDVIALKRYGVFMLYSGHPDKAIHLIENSLRFDPYTTPGNLMNLSFAYYLVGRYEDAIRVSERALTKHPDFAGHHIALAAAYAQSGRKEDAEREVEKVHELFPFMPIESFGSIFLDPKDRASIMDGLRKAGLK
jgi:tetratricopeptide (TPR) repeat protein